jgi:hypothetical protein
MKRALPIAAALAALTLIAPSAVLASHGHRHHHHKAALAGHGHRHHHKAHHAKVHFEHFGPATLGSAGTGTQPSTSPASPTLPPVTPPVNENAGKVASYTGGVLTLTLNDGSSSSVSGKVTADTQIECVSATAPSSGQEEAPGDDNGQGDDQSQGDRNQGDHGNGNAGDQPSTHQPQAIQGDDDDQPPTSEPPCDTSALVPNTIVRAAELRIGPSGNEFESIELVR